MPTVYQRIQAYYMRPDAIFLSRNKRGKIGKILKYIWDRQKDNPALEYVESIEGEKRCIVRNYPLRFQRLMDDITLQIANEVKRHFASEEQPKIATIKNPPPTEKRERKRIPLAAKKVYASKFQR